MALVRLGDPLQFGLGLVGQAAVGQLLDAVGQAINAIFTAFISREFGRDAFDVRRVEGMPGQTLQEVGR